MSDNLSRTQMLAGLLLERPLAEYVAEKRAQERPRWSWQNIADQIGVDTDNRIVISAEMLRQWYGLNDEAVA